MSGSRRRAPLLLLPLLAALLSCKPATVPAVDYAAEIAEHRERREAALRSEEGWLTLIGLFWLQEGDNRFGSGEGNEIRLPADAAPARAGRFVYGDGRIRLVVESRVEMTMDGRPVREWEAGTAVAPPQQPFRLGRLRLLVLERGGRHAIRVKDPESSVRTGFAGLDYYPVEPAYRVEGRFRAHPSPLRIEVPTVAGTTAEFEGPGLVEFEIGDGQLVLEALAEDAGDPELFFIFRDQTSGDTTYPAGRYLYGTREGDRVLLDFNQAYNPPCAFTAYATCPLPPPGNRLAVRVEAGEKRYGGAAAGH